MRATTRLASLALLAFLAGVLLSQEKDKDKPKGEAGAAGRAAAWGNLTGTFIYDGAIPEPQPVTVRRGVPIRDESLVLGKMAGVKNIVVRLVRGADEEPPPVHPSYDAAADADVRLEMLNSRFKPHVVLARTSQTLVVSNKDAVAHCLKIQSIENPPHASLRPPGNTQRLHFRAKEHLPVAISCPIHAGMSGWLFVQDHPYMAVTDERGSFTISNLPVGEWTFWFWHEKAGYIRHVTQDGEKKDWPHGRLTVSIKAGENHLGTLRLAPSLFSGE